MTPESVLRTATGLTEEQIAVQERTAWQEMQRYRRAWRQGYRAGLAEGAVWTLLVGVILAGSVAELIGR